MLHVRSMKPICQWNQEQRNKCPVLDELQQCIDLQQTITSAEAKAYDEAGFRAVAKICWRPSTIHYGVVPSSHCLIYGQGSVDPC